MAELDNKLKLSDYKDTKTRDVYRIRWPGSDREIGLLLLTCGELQRCHLAARQWFRKQGQDVDIFSADQLVREEEHQMLAEMVVDPESKTGAEKLFRSATDVRDAIGPDEREYFITHHVKLQTERSANWEFPDIKEDRE